MAEFAANHAVSVEWLAYELRPEPVPVPAPSTLAERERSRARWEQGVMRLAREYGVEMRQPETRSRSRLAHEAAEFARERGAFDAMRVALFRAYFVDGRDIGDPAVLAELGASVGLDPADLQAALTEGRYTAGVVEQEELAASWGIAAVPSIVIGRYLVEGAQPYAVLRDVLARAEQEQPGEV